MKPLVSVIIPVYNAELTIINTLDSVLNQTWENLEIICVNDGSSDKSLEILDAFQKKYQEKIFVFDIENSGACKARNVGISKAKGDYIQFLDADDFLSLNKIESQLKLLKGKNANTISICEWVNFYPEKGIFKQIPYGAFQDFNSGLDLLLRLWNYQEMLANSCYLTHISLIRKAGNWNESIQLNQDGEFFCRVLLEAQSILFEPTGKAYYRKPNNNSVSRQNSEKAIESLLESLKSYEKHTLQVEDSRRVRLSLKKVYQKFIYDVYPNYPHLIKEAEKLQSNLGIFEEASIGGPKFKFISKILGFKNALRIKKTMNFKSICFL